MKSYSTNAAEEFANIMNRAKYGEIEMTVRDLGFLIDKYFWIAVIESDEEFWEDKFTQWDIPLTKPVYIFGHGAIPDEDMDDEEKIKHMAYILMDMVVDAYWNETLWDLYKEIYEGGVSI